MEMCLLAKLRIDWSNDCGDFFPRELVKFILTNLKRNISPLKLQTNVNAHAQIYFAAKSNVNQTPWKHQKTKSIGGIERSKLYEMG